MQEDWSNYSCLNKTSCDANSNTKYIFNFMCNYFVDDNTFLLPNPNTTCSMGSEFIRKIYPTCQSCLYMIDCCYKDSIDECCYGVFKTHMPTYQPTIYEGYDGDGDGDGDDNRCNDIICEDSYYHDKCYFYEFISDDACLDENNNIVCCHSDRSKCCIFRKMEIFGGAFLLIASTLLYFGCYLLYYRHLEFKRLKIHTELQCKKVYFV